MRVYIGYDPRDELAFRACVSSLRKHASIPLDIIPLKDHELRRMGVYYRTYHVEKNGQRIDDGDGRPFSTEFSFTRFCVPLIDKSDELVLFCDADMLWFDDVAKLVREVSDSGDERAIYCVHHDYQPKEGEKFDGMLQQRYFRKNWSSMMLLRPARCKLTQYQVNSQTGAWLQQLHFLTDDMIGAIPAGWNWLEGWHGDDTALKVLHYTRGTPDILGDDLPHSALWWEAVKAWHPSMNRNGIYDDPQDK